MPNLFCRFYVSLSPRLSKTAIYHCADAVAMHVGTPDDRIQDPIDKQHTCRLLPVSCDLDVPTAPKRCYYIKYLPMALLLANSSRSFFVSLLSLNSDLIKGPLVYSYLPTKITFT